MDKKTIIENLYVLKGILMGALSMDKLEIIDTKFQELIKEIEQRVI